MASLTKRPSGIAQGSDVPGLSLPESWGRLNTAESKSLSKRVKVCRETSISMSEFVLGELLRGKTASGPRDTTFGMLQKQNIEMLVSNTAAR